MVAAVSTLKTSAKTTTTPVQPTGAGVQTNTYAFLAGWILMIALLILINRSRLGHVIIYYSLLLIILFILVTESGRIAPILGGAVPIGQLKQ